MGPSSTFCKKYWYIFWPYHGKYRNLATNSWTSGVGVTGENVFIFHNYIAIMQSFNFLSRRNARSSFYVCKLSIWVVKLFFSQPGIIPFVSNLAIFCTFSMKNDVIWPKTSKHNTKSATGAHVYHIWLFIYIILCLRKY